MGVAQQAVAETAVPVRVVRLLLMAVVAIVVGDVAALATRSAPSAGAGRAAGSDLPVAPTAPSREPPPASSRSTPTTGGGRAAGTQSPPPTADPNDWLLPVGSNGYAYEVDFNPTCARPGEVLTVTLRLKPKWGAAGSAMPVYSDGSREPGKGAIANPDGTFTYSWVARPVLGEGRLVTQAQDADTGEFGTKILSFRVVELGGSC